MLVEKWLVEVIMATMDSWVSPTFRKLEVGQKHHIIIPMIFPSRFVAPQQSVVDLTTIGPVLVRTCEFHPQNRHHHGPPGPRRFGWDIMGYHGNVMGILWNVMGMLWECYGIWILQMIKKPGKSCQSKICCILGESIPKKPLEGPPINFAHTNFGWSFTQVGGVISMSGHDLRV